MVNISNSQSQTRNEAERTRHENKISGAGFRFSVRTVGIFGCCERRGRIKSGTMIRRERNMEERKWSLQVAVKRTFSGFKIKCIDVDGRRSTDPY